MSLETQQRGWEAAWEACAAVEGSRERLEAACRRVSEQGDVDALLYGLNRFAVRLRVERGALRVSAPPGTLTPAIGDFLKTHKDAVMARVPWDDGDPSFIVAAMPGPLTIDYFVAFRPTGALPTTDELLSTVAARLGDGAALPFTGAALPVVQPLRGRMGAMLEAGAVRAHAGRREDVPQYVLDNVIAFAGSEVDEERFRLCTHMVFVSVNERLLFPHVGVWTSFVAAQAIAEKLRGLVMDPVTFSVRTPEAMPSPDPECRLPSTMTLLRLSVVRDEQGGLTMQTLGLQRFQLPELRVDGVDASQQEAMAALMHAASFRLMSVAREQVRAAMGGEYTVTRAFEGKLPSLRIPRRLTVSRWDVARAMAGEYKKIEVEDAEASIRLRTDVPGRVLILDDAPPALAALFGV